MTTNQEVEEARERLAAWNRLAFDRAGDKDRAEEARRQRHDREMKAARQRLRSAEAYRRLTGG